MNIFKKIKNHRASAESAMFVLGIAIFATVVVFALDIFGLTWQRYLSTRELSNISRLYAIRAYDLYYDTDQYGTLSTITIRPDDSDLGDDIKRSLQILVEHGQTTKATATIKTEANVLLLRVEVTQSDADVTYYAPVATIKQLGYGDTLFATLTVEYNHSSLSGIASQQEAHSKYSISNKFAFESKERVDTGVD